MKRCKECPRRGPHIKACQEKKFSQIPVSDHQSIASILDTPLSINILQYLSTWGQ
jgi:hypothetical protein